MGAHHSRVAQGQEGQAQEQQEQAAQQQRRLTRGARQLCRTGAAPWRCLLGGLLCWTQQPAAVCQ